MADEELQQRVRSLEARLTRLQDELDENRRKDAYIMRTIGKQNLQHNLTQDLMFAGNLVWNSSFEMPTTGVLPNHWTAGVSSIENAFIGMVSLKLIAGQSSEQTLAAYIPVTAFGDEQIRVTFAQLGGSVRVEIIDQSGIAMLSHDFNQTDSWYNGRRTLTVQPGSATSVHLRFTCIDTVNPVYIDAVQVEPDVLRKWPSLYMDGPKSGAYASEAPQTGGGGGGGGAVPTIFVAAADCSAKIKAVADYVCDGVADDVEINAAIAAASGARVVLSDGLFYIAGPIAAPTSQYSAYMLCGMGRGTYLWAQSVMPTVLGGSQVAAVTVRDLVIDGNNMAVTGIDYSLYQDNYLIENVDVGYCTGDAMKIGQVLSSGYYWPTVRECTAHDNGGSGFILGDYGVAIDSKAFLNGVDGFRLSSSGQALGCYAGENAAAGFSVSGMQWAFFNRCMAEFNETGIKVIGTSQSQVTNNTLRGNKRHGILVSSTRVQVVGNLIMQSGSEINDTYSNIQVENANNCTVTANVCDRNGAAGGAYPKYGINIASGNANWVANNHCFNGGWTAGIANTATGTILDPGNIRKDGTWSNLPG